ncbi:MAG: DUF2865 domain-containing protein [Pseudomonadota bacterium]
MLVLGVLGGSVFLTSTAQAQDRCTRIQNELIALNSGGGGQAAELRRAIDRQAREMSRAQRAYGQLGCDFRGSMQCNSIIGAMNQMQSNIAAMQRQLQRAGGGGNPTRIRELERVFATECGPNQRRPVERAARSERRSLLESLFGSRAARPDSTRDQSAIVLPNQRRSTRGFDPLDGERTREPRFRSAGNTFRTMCVRKSDGFYWPISFSTTRDRFDEDQGLCAAMCPGTSVELFAYRNPGEQINAMVSTQSGERYTQQSYAFSYRENFDPDNRCTPSAAILQDLRSATGIASGPTAPSVPQPSIRPMMELDPETRALASSNTSFQDLANMGGDLNASASVRVVGPQYRYFTE